MFWKNQSTETRTPSRAFWPRWHASNFWSLKIGIDPLPSDFFFSVLPYKEHVDTLLNSTASIPDSRPKGVFISESSPSMEPASLRFRYCVPLWLLRIASIIWRAGHIYGWPRINASTLKSNVRVHTNLQSQGKSGKEIMIREIHEKIGQTVRRIQGN